MKNTPVKNDRSILDMSIYVKGLIFLISLFLLFISFSNKPVYADATCQEYLSQCSYLSGNASWQVWQNTEPGGGGYFMDVSFGPDDTIIAGSDLGGYYRSTDNGTTWRQHGVESGLTATHVHQVGHHPVDPNIVFIGGSTNGLYKSTDGGLTVSRVFTAEDKICAIEATGTRVYIAAAPVWNSDCDLIYSSNDTGDSWSLAYTFTDDVNITDLRINPNDQTNVIAISQESRWNDPTDKNLYETEDSFSTVDQVPMAEEIFGADWSSDGTLLYFSSLGASSTGSLYSKPVGYNSPQTLLNSNFTGQVWIPAGTSDVIRLVDQRIYGAANPRQGVNESTDGGASFSRIAEWPADMDFGWAYNGQFTSSFYNNFSFSKTNPDNAGYVTSSRVNLTLDGGHSIVQSSSYSIDGGWNSTGLNNTVPVTVAQHPLDNNLVIAGFADIGCYRSSNGGDSWINCAEDNYNGDWGDYGGNIQAIVMDPDDTNKAWMASGRRSGDSYLIKTTTGHQTGNWFDSGSGLPAPNDYVNDIVLDSSSAPGNRTLFSVVDGDVYKSTDDGNNWSLVYACGDCHRVEVDPESNLVAAGGNSGLAVSTSNGDLGSWSSIPLSTFVGGGSTDIRETGYTGVADITDDQNSSGVLWIALNDESVGGIYRYESGSAVLSEANQDTRTIEVADDGTVYYGASNAFNSGNNSSQDSTAVRYSVNDGASWNQLSTPLEYPYVVDIVIPEGDQNTMWVVSPGAGVYKVYRNLEETDLSISITDGVIEVEEGENITFITTITNEGTRPVNSFSFGQLPFSNATHVSGPNILSGGGSLTPTSFVTHDWNGTLLGGQSIVIEYIYNASGDPGDAVHISASVSQIDNSAGSLYETNNSNDLSSDNNTIIQEVAGASTDDPSSDSDTSAGSLANTGFTVALYLLFGSGVSIATIRLVKSIDSTYRLNKR